MAFLTKEELELRRNPPVGGYKPKTKGERDEVVAKVTEDQRKRYAKGAIPLDKRFGISGVYLLFRDCEIVYIGESKCIYTRIAQHVQDEAKQFDSFKFIRVKGRKARLRKERQMIKRHRPLLNVTHNYT